MGGRAGGARMWVMSENRPQASGQVFPEGAAVAVIASRWNAPIVEALLEGCVERIRALGGNSRVQRVPGAFELPTAALWAAQGGSFDAVIVLGCVIRGETPHFELVAGECARGTMRVSLDTGVPVIFGVLTVNTQEQAIARAGGDHGHAGIASADAACDMLVLLSPVSCLPSPPPSPPTTPPSPSIPCPARR